MRQAGVGGGVMLASGTRDDFGIEPVLFVIGAEVYGETVLEGVLDDLHGRMIIIA